MARDCSSTGFYTRNLLVFLVLFIVWLVCGFRPGDNDLEHFPEVQQGEVEFDSLQFTLGRMLFYDPILSKDSTISCASCHQQKYAFGSNKAFDSTFTGSSTSRNTPPIYNLKWYKHFFWDGRSTSIERQISHPIKNEMGLTWSKVVDKLHKNSQYRSMFYQVYKNNKLDSTQVMEAIGQFERAIISYKSKYDRVLQFKDFFDSLEYAGFELVNDMTRGGCLHCHTTDHHGLGTSGDFANNGLDLVPDSGRAKITKNSSDMGAFKIPSLRNLAFSQPYMHDGRFENLDEVLDFYSRGVQSTLYTDNKMAMKHQGGMHFTKAEKQAIIAFLETMNDSNLVKNPIFSNPF